MLPAELVDREFGYIVGRADGRAGGRTVGRADGRTGGRTVGRAVGRLGQSLKASPKSPQSFPKASPKLPQSFPKASPKPPQSLPKSSPDLVRFPPDSPEARQRPTEPNSSKNAKMLHISASENWPKVNVRPDCIRKSGLQMLLVFLDPSFSQSTNLEKGTFFS